MGFENRDRMDVAYDRFENALEFAHVAIRWCKVCARKIYILRRDSDGQLNDYTADGAEHMFLECGEDIDEGQVLSRKAAEFYASGRAERYSRSR